MSQRNVEMAAGRTLFGLLLFISGTALAIECYTGWTYVKGQPIATGKETCSFKKYCYNLTLDSTGITDGVKKAGCSTFRCGLSGTGCRKMDFSGHKLTLCCCNNADKCNSKYTEMKITDKIKEGTKDVKALLDDIWKKLENPFG